MRFEYYIKNLIINSLYSKNLIDEELYLKCKPKYIRDLPFDLRTNDPEKLGIRREAIRDRIRELRREIDDKESRIKLRGWYRQNPKDKLNEIIETGESSFKKMNSIDIIWDDFPDVSEYTKEYFMNNIPENIKINNDVFTELKGQLTESLESGEDVVSRRLIKTYSKNAQRLVDMLRNVRISLEFDYGGTADDYLWSSNVPSDLNKNLGDLSRYNSMLYHSTNRLRQYIDYHVEEQKRYKKSRGEVDKLVKELDDLQFELDRMSR